MIGYFDTIVNSEIENTVLPSFLRIQQLQNIKLEKGTDPLETIKIREKMSHNAEKSQRGTL